MVQRITMAKKKTKRHYSREFQPSGDKVRALTISKVPPSLLRAFRTKVKEARLSQRVVVLTWMKNWTEGREPGDNGARA
jgi:hypothetical protein